MIRTNFNQEVAPATPLKDRQRHNAADIVVHGRPFLLAVVANKMRALSIALHEDIKKKWLYIIVEGFVVKKKLGQKAEILTVDFVFASVDFKYGYIVRAIDFLSGRKVHHALCSMSHRHESALHVF